MNPAMLLQPFANLLSKGHISMVLLGRLRLGSGFLKSFFTNNETFLFIKGRRAQVCRTFLMHWFVYLISKRSSSRRAHSRKFFAWSDPQRCIGVER